MICCIPCVKPCPVSHGMSLVLPFLPDELKGLVIELGPTLNFNFFNQVKPSSSNLMFREEMMQFLGKCVLRVVELVKQGFINRITLRTISVQNSSEFYTGCFASGK